MAVNTSIAAAEAVEQIQAIPRGRVNITCPALAGRGVTAIPDELCRQEIAEGKLETVLPHWQLLSPHLYIVYTSRRGLIPAVRAIIDFAAERLAAVYAAGARPTAV